MRVRARVSVCVRVLKEYTLLLLFRITMVRIANTVFLFVSLSFLLETKIIWVAREAEGSRDERKVTAQVGSDGYI